jgi:hypothetical protein
MKFWNDKEGIAMGDPNRSSSIIVTRWGIHGTKFQQNESPEIADGEAALWQANTNIVVKGNNT